MVGGQLEVIWKKLSRDAFRENGMRLESPFKELGVMLEAGRQWGKQACSADSVPGPWVNIHLFKGWPSWVTSSSATKASHIPEMSETLE